MNEELIRELMSDIEDMAWMIEGEWGSCFTTLEEMIDGGDMPDSYYKLKSLHSNRSSKSLGKMNMNKLMNDIALIKPEDAPLHSSFRKLPTLP